MVLTLPMVKSAKKSANKSADKSANKSANSILTKRQKEIIGLMEEGEEYITEFVADKIGLKAPRTRQILNELADLGLVESLGTTKDRRYKKK